MKTLLLLILAVSTVVSAQGSALLVGGGREDRNEWSDRPYGWFVQQADSGVIINIDTDDVSDWYPTYFQWLGASPDSRALRIRDRAAANDSAIYQQLMSADGIFMEGGDQSEYVNAWKGTLVEAALEAVFARGGAIGGTSAGLAVLGEVVYDAQNGSAQPDRVCYDPYNTDVTFTDDFLDILPGVFTDSHFHPRNRLARLVPMLARRIQDFGQSDLMGIGVDDKTAFCVGPDRRGTAMGMGTVTILYAGPDSRISATSRQAPTVTDLRYHMLIDGAAFDLDARALVDPGPDMAAVTPSFGGTVLPMTIAGSDRDAGEAGTWVVTGLTPDPLAAWNGNLGLQQGSDSLPSSVVMPRVWNDLDFSENRWVGGFYAAAAHPGLLALWLDDGRSVSIDAGGVLTVSGAAWILDTAPVTHAGFTSRRSTNYPGIVNARLHFLGDGDRFDLNQRRVLTAFDGDGQGQVLPTVPLLHPAWPNPFNPVTTLMLELPRAAPIRLEIVDTLGRRVATLLEGRRSAGRHTVVWTAEDAVSGVYFAVLTAPSVQAVRRLLLVR